MCAFKDYSMHTSAILSFGCHCQHQCNQIYCNCCLVLVISNSVLKSPNIIRSQLGDDLTLMQFHHVFPENEATITHQISIQEIFCLIIACIECRVHTQLLYETCLLACVPPPLHTPLNSTFCHCISKTKLYIVLVNDHHYHSITFASIFQRFSVNIPAQWFVIAMI